MRRTRTGKEIVPYDPEPEKTYKRRLREAKMAQQDDHDLAAQLRETQELLRLSKEELRQEK